MSWICVFMWIMNDCSCPSLLCSAERNSAVGHHRVLRCLHPNLRHHREYRVSVSQGGSTCFLLFTLPSTFDLYFWHNNFILCLFYYIPMCAALCDHSAVCSGGDCGVCNPLPDPPAQEASPLVVDLPPSPQDQGVLPV